MAERMTWEPLREAVTLREAIDRLFQDSFVRPSGTAGTASNNLPVDVYETTDDYVVIASLPGIAPEAVEITVHGEVLTIKAEHQEEQAPEGAHWLVRERRPAAAGRQIQLPRAVVADRADAEFSNGVLRLTLPKAESEKPKTIRIGAKAQA